MAGEATITWAPLRRGWLPALRKFSTQNFGLFSLPSLSLSPLLLSTPFFDPRSSPHTLSQTITMGFTDFASETGLTIANSYLATRSYIVGYVAKKTLPSVLAVLVVPLL